MANVYGFNNHTQHICFFQDLSSKILDLKGEYPSAAVIVGGDFNEAPDPCLDRFPPKRESCSYITILNDFCSNLSLLDAYRFMLAGNDCSYTWFGTDLSRKSCLDYCLISDFMSPFIKSSGICHAPVRGHAFYRPDSGAGCHRNPGYWKLNCSLLQIPSYSSGIKNIIAELKAKPAVSVSSNWEMFKYECRKFSIRFSKQLAKVKSLRFIYLGRNESNFRQATDK